MTNEPRDHSAPPSWSQKLSPYGAAGESVLRYDWSNTELGALESWPAALAVLVEATLASSVATALAIGPQRRLIANARARSLFGASAPLATGDNAISALLLVWPAAGRAFERAFSGERVSAAGQPFGAPGGASVVVDVGLAPLRWPDGAPACVQAQFIESQADKPAGAGFAAWSVAADGGWVAASPRWADHTGQSEPESQGSGWLQALHPDDRANAQSVWTEAQLRGELEADLRIYDRRRDAYRWRRIRASRAGAQWLATAIDIDDLRAARDEQAVALAESRRRTRNTLGIVRSIARRTAETSDNVESCAMHFEGRLDALARVGSLAAGSKTSGVPLDALIAEELFSFKAREDAGLQISGPPVRVRPEAAEMVGLAVHELAVNAMKFGALSPAGGKLEITWRMLGRDPDALALSWIESGVAAGANPQRADGFGADLIKRGLAYALNARTQFLLQADGLSCTMEFPATMFLA